MWKTPVVERRNDGVLVYWSEKLSVNDLCVKSQDGSKGSEHKRLDVRNDSSPSIQKKYSRPRRIPSDGRDTVSIVIRSFSGQFALVPLGRANDTAGYNRQVVLNPDSVGC